MIDEKLLGVWLCLKSDSEEYAVGIYQDEGDNYYANVFYMPKYSESESEQEATVIIEDAFVTAIRSDRAKKPSHLFDELVISIIESEIAILIFISPNGVRFIKAGPSGPPNVEERPLEEPSEEIVSYIQRVG